MKWFPALLIFVCGCASKNANPGLSLSSSGLELQMEQRIKKLNPAYRLDSFRIVKTDTLTEKDKLRSICSAASDSLLKMKLRMETVGELFNANMRLARIYRKAGNKQYQRFSSDARANKEQYEMFNHEIDLIRARAMRYDSLLQVCDSTRPAYFSNACFYRLRRPDQSVGAGTAFILVDENKEVISKEDFLKLP